jgi:uncharacterized repeat protein (TIGR03806 family)
VRRVRAYGIASLGCASVFVVTGCGGGSGGEPDSAPPPDAASPDATCPVSGGEGVSFDPEAPPCEKLSSYRFFVDGAGQRPNEGVVPFDVNSPLFSDYALKQRFLWLPEGTSMDYHEEEAFAFPVGAVLIKTFYYPEDAREEGGPRRLLETRLLVHREHGWDGLIYQWDEEQQEARHNRFGDVVPVSWIDHEGEPRELNYLVPDVNQCQACHVRDREMVPIAPQARHLNRDFDYGDGPKNQLTHLAELGALRGAPADPDDAPRAPVYDDPDTGSVEERARAWLDINCAHCHNPVGPGRTSGLDLQVSQTEPIRYGVCKPPVAAGAGSGGLQYGIVPGEPEASILVFRIESTQPNIQMPELMRQLPHEEGNALVRAWISEMEGSCGPDDEGDSLWR